MIADALTSSVVDFEDYSPSFQSGSDTCISIIHRSMTDRILHSSAQKIVLPATKESAAAYRLNRAEIIGNGFFCFWSAANGSLNENRFHASIFKTVN